MDSKQLSAQDFPTNGNIGIRVYRDAQSCVVIERHSIQSPWREIGQTFALPLPEGFDVPVMVPGPIGKLNLAVTLYELEHPEQGLRSLLVALKTTLNEGAETNSG